MATPTKEIIPQKQYNLLATGAELLVIQQALEFMPYNQVSGLLHAIGDRVSEVKAPEATPKQPLPDQNKSKQQSNLNKASSHR